MSKKMKNIVKKMEKLCISTSKMKCSICKQEGHNKRSCKEKTTPVSAPKIETETDVKVIPQVKIEPEMTSSITREDAEKNGDDDIFSYIKYCEKLDKSINKILSRPVSEKLTYDILDTEKSKQNKLISLKEKQRQMKVGVIWQEVLGSYNGYKNLKVGHCTGLDIISYTKKIAIELKNRTNTDNASSKTSNLNKLYKFKESHPDYICIYANINDDTEQKTLNGNIKKIIHDDGVELEHQTGYKFLKFILGNDTDKIIDFVRKSIEKYQS